MDIQLKEKLEKAGLTENEALIYSFLLDVGGAYPSNIAQATGINRSTVYKSLLQMNIKNIVSEVERHKKLFYQITTSSALVINARQQMRIAESQYDSAASLLPTLDHLIENVGYKPKIITFEGAEGIVKLLEDHLNQERPYEMLAISKAEQLYKVLPKHFFDHYRKTKETLGITTRGIVPDTKENRGFVRKAYVNFGIQKKYWPEIRFIDPKLFIYDAEITIYGERRVSIAKLTEKQALGAIIEDEVVHGMFKMMFEVMWGNKA